jgi:hypothetical protein
VGGVKGRRRVSKLREGEREGWVFSPQKGKMKEVEVGERDKNRHGRVVKVRLRSEESTVTLVV